MQDNTNTLNNQAPKQPSNQALKRKRGRPKSINPEDLIKWAHDFKKATGYFPGRDDMKGEVRKQYAKKLNMPMPHATTIERIFGKWSDFRTACGETQSKFTHTKLAEATSIKYLTEKYGFEEHPANAGHVDGYINDKRIEVKAATLRKASRGNKFRWRLHNREYSKLVDEMFLIGISETGDVLVEIHLANQTDILNTVDLRDYIELHEDALKKGTSNSLIWPYVTCYKAP